MRKFIYLLLLMILVSVSAYCQVPTQGAVQPESKHWSAEMEKLNKEYLKWRSKPPTRQRFDEVTKRLITLAKDDRQAGNAYLLLARIYANVASNKMRDDSLAIYYSKQAMLNLPLPEEKAMYSVALHQLGFVYLYPGERQNAYMTAECLSKTFLMRPQGSPDYGDMFLFGWGVKQDLYLATNIYTICQMKGNNGADDQLNYINYFLDNLTKGNIDTRAFEGLEHYLYSNFILRDSRRGFYALTMSAEMSLPTAMMELAMVYENDLAGATEITNKTEGFHWFREAADKNYPPALLGLAKFCMRHMMDTLYGDINRPDDRGRYSASTKARVNQQAVGLMRRAAAMGYAQAQIELGDIMMDAPKYYIGQPDYMEATKWFTATTYSSFNNIFNKIDLLQRKMDTAQVQYAPQAYVNAIKEGQAQSTSQQLQYSKMMESIIRNTDVVHPTNPRSTAIRHSLTKEQRELKESLGVPDGDEDDLVLAIAYQTVYDTYTSLLKEMDGPDIKVNQSLRRFIQCNMTHLRTYAKGMKYNLIKESPWEEWSGK